MSDQPAPIRVVIVDDHPVFRLGLAAAIAEMDGIRVVGEAADGRELTALLGEVDPDVVLLDIHLPDTSGLDVNRWLAERHPTVRVLMLTMSEDVDSARTALRDGARGYLVKGADADRVEQAVRAIATGAVVVEPSFVPGFVGPESGRRNGDRPFAQLTDREFEVLQLLAEGFDNGAIARQLVVNPKTVRNHVSNVFAKLHVTDRAGAIVLARRHGLGT